MEGLQAEIIAAKNKINRYERVFKRIAPQEYAEEESKPESAVLDVASLYHELASETENMRGSDAEAYEEFSATLRKMRGDASGGGKRNKKSKKRKSKRRRKKSKKRKSKRRKYKTRRRSR